MEGGDGDGFYLSVCLPNDKLIRRNVIEWLVMGKDGSLELGWVSDAKQVNWMEKRSVSGWICNGCVSWWMLP